MTPTIDRGTHALQCVQVRNETMQPSVTSMMYVVCTSCTNCERIRYGQEGQLGLDTRGSR